MKYLPFLLATGAAILTLSGCYKCPESRMPLSKDFQEVEASDLGDGKCRVSYTDKHVGYTATDSNNEFPFSLSVTVTTSPRKAGKIWDYLQDSMGKVPSRDIQAGVLGQIGGSSYAEAKAEFSPSSSKDGSWRLRDAVFIDGKLLYVEGQERCTDSAERDFCVYALTGDSKLPWDYVGSTDNEKKPLKSGTPYFRHISGLNFSNTCVSSILEGHMPVEEGQDLEFLLTPREIPSDAGAWVRAVETAGTQCPTLLRRIK